MITFNIEAPYASDSDHDFTGETVTLHRFGKQLSGVIAHSQWRGKYLHWFVKWEDDYYQWCRIELLEQAA